MFNSLNDHYLTIWCLLENGYWVMDRSYSQRYAKLVVKGKNELNKYPQRYYALFPMGVNANQYKTRRAVS